MEQSNQSKRVLLSVIGVAILVVAVVGVSFAFFNYTRAGQQNSVQTGKIWFGSTQSGAIALTNVFPGATNGQTVQVHVNGGTTYSGGLTYELRAVNVTNASTIPVLVDTAVNSTSGGTIESAGTYTPQTAVALAEGALLGSGTVAFNASATENDVTGDIDVRVYIDPDVAITDTLESDAAPSGYVNGTTDGWLDGRTRVTTSDWNALATNPVTFRVLVQAVEAGGTYVVS